MKNKIHTEFDKDKLLSEGWEEIKPLIKGNNILKRTVSLKPRKSYVIKLLKKKGQ